MTMLIVLRLLHVVTGVLWVGTVVFMTFYLLPVLRGAGPAAAGPVMAGLVKRGTMNVLPLVALVTVASGMGLVWLASNGDLAGYARTSSGSVFTASGGLAILAFAIGITVSRPAGVASGRLAARLATVTDPSEREAIGAEMAKLQRRNNLGSRALAVLVLLATLGMAVARYV